MKAQSKRFDSPRVTQEMPADIEAERALLDCLIMGGLKSGEVMESATVSDFYDVRNGAIYSVIHSMWQRNLTPELPMLIGELTAAGRLEEAGGIGYVSEIIGGHYASPSNILQYRNKIKTKRFLRELAFLGEAAKNAAFEAHRGEGDAFEVVDDLMAKLATIGKQAASDDRGKTRLDAAISLIYSMEESSSQVRVFIDLAKIDEVTGGARAGELWIITAETGVGKSFLALQINRRACADGHHVLYASGEMLAEHLMGRVVASNAEIPYIKIRRPELLSPDERRGLMEASGRQCKVCRIIDGELTLARIRSACRSMSSNKELGCLIVDYDELVAIQSTSKSDWKNSEWEEQRILVRSLKSLAMELGVPCFLVSQLRKSMDPQDQKRPTLQRLYGSGAKAKHASVVIHVDRPFVRNLKGDETEAHIFILKSRDGRIGRTECVFNLRTFRFEQKVEEVPEA